MIKPFLNENFLLQNLSAAKLYHNFAKDLPIIDYHNHLPPDEIANDKNFATITEAWLKGDHYKWRAMRANYGISNRRIRDPDVRWCVRHSSASLLAEAVYSIRCRLF